MKGLNMIPRKDEANVDIHRKIIQCNHIDPPFTYHTNLTIKRQKTI